MTLQRCMERIAEREVERITAKCQRYQDMGKQVPRWVRAGMDERFRRVEQIEQRVQMLLGVFASHGVLPLEFKPAYSVGDLLLQHLDALEQEAEEKGGVQQVLANHFAKVYKVNLPMAAWRSWMCSKERSCTVALRHPCIIAMTSALGPPARCRVDTIH